MKIIELFVDSKGNTRLQTKGFSGTECRDASAELEKALGEKSAEQLTAEFYQTQATNDQRERQRP